MPSKKNDLFKKKPLLEKEIETQILDWLNCLDQCFAIKINTGGIFDPKIKKFRTIQNKHIHKGTSDILGCFRGRFFAIEVKSGKNKPSDEQKLFIARVIDNGGIATVSNSLDEVRSWFADSFPDFEYAKTQQGDSILFRENI